MVARLDPIAFRMRPMREADARSVAVNERAAYEFPWSEDVIRDCLRVGYNCWVAEATDGIFGHWVLAVAAGEAHLLNLCVHPRHQRQGIGRAMLQHVLAIARGHGADTLYLEVRPSNKPALRLYRDAGFERIGMRREYYPARAGQREDALVYSFQL